MSLFLKISQKLCLFYLIALSASAFSLPGSMLNVQSFVLSAGAFEIVPIYGTQGDNPAGDSTPPYLPDPWPCDQWQACSTPTVADKEPLFVVAPGYHKETIPGTPPIIMDGGSPPYMPDPWPCDENESCSIILEEANLLHEHQYFDSTPIAENELWLRDSSPIVEDVVIAPVKKHAEEEEQTPIHQNFLFKQI